jgi:antitoxin FitA
MSSITVHNLDPAIKARLRVRAAKHGHSMAAEVRSLLQAALNAPKQPAEPNLYERIRARFAPFGGVEDLEIPRRELGGNPPQFD